MTLNTTAPADARHQPDPSTAREPIIAVDRLTHTYPGAAKPAIDNLELTIQPGTFNAILGPNGSGKSTLFKILTTAVIPSGKPGVIPRITMLGHDIRVGGHVIRQQLGVVFQNPSLDHELTVTENLRLQGRMYGMPGAPLKQRIQQRLEHLGLTDRAHDKVATLSGGLARRVELAKALLHNPRILILDEPSTGVDPTARRQFWQALDQERQRTGLTILMTTHLTDEAEAADRVLILADGKLITQGTPAQLKADDHAVITIATHNTDDLADLTSWITDHFNAAPLPERRVGEARLELANGPDALRWLLDHHHDTIASVTLSAPTLEDIFERTTGQRFNTTS